MSISGKVGNEDKLPHRGSMAYAYAKVANIPPRKVIKNRDGQLGIHLRNN